MRNNKQIDMRKLDENYAEILFVARDTGSYTHNSLMSDTRGMVADYLTKFGFLKKKHCFEFDIDHTYYLTFKGHWLAYNFKRMVENEEN